MLQAAISLANSGTKPAPKVKDKSSVMAPAERPTGKKSLIPDSGYLGLGSYISNDLDQALYICTSRVFLYL